MANGSQNTGLNTTTTVLEGGLEPLQSQIRINEQRRRDELIRQQRAQQSRAARDKQIGELLKWKPEKAWEPFNSQVRSQAQQLRNWTIDQINAGVDPNNPQFQKMLGENQNAILDIVDRSNWLKDQFTSATNQIKNNPYLKSNEAFSALNDIFYDDIGNGRNPFQINPDAIQNIMQNPQFFDRDKLAGDFIKGLPQEIESYVNTRNTEAGQEVTSSNEVKKSIFVTNQRDQKTGTYKVNITDELIEMANQNPMIRTILDSDQRSDRMVLEELLGPSLVAQREVKKKTEVQPQDEGSGGTAQVKKSNRVESLRKSVFDFDKAELSRAVGGNGGFGRIVGVVKPPKILPGQSGDELIMFYKDPSFVGESTKLTQAQLESLRPEEAKKYGLKSRTFNRSTPEGRRQLAIAINRAIDDKEEAADTKFGWDEISPEWSELEGASETKPPEVKTANDFLSKYP